MKQRSRAWSPAGLVLVLAAVLAETASAAVSPTDLVQLADIAGLAVSPNGQHVAFRVERARIDANRYVSDWFVADLASRSVRRVGDGGAPIHVDPGFSPSERARWSADGSSIRYRALVDGAVELWEAFADGSGGRRILRDDADIVAFDTARHGKAIIYRVGPTRAEIRRAEEAEYDAGIQLDPSVDLAQAAFRGAIINGRRATQRLVGRWFARDALLWRRPAVTKRLDRATGLVAPAPEAQERHLAGGAERIGEGLAATSASGQVATAHETDGSWSIEVRGSHGEAEPVVCAAPQCRQERIDWLAWRPASDELIFATRDSSQRQSLHLWTVASGSVRTVVRSDGLLSGSRDFWSPCAIAVQFAVCVTTGALSPPRLEAIDLGTGGRTILHDPNRLLRSRRAVHAERLSWEAGAGHAFTGILLLPTGSGAPALPLFVTYYSCDGFLRGGVGDEWPLPTLAGSGIAVLCINRTSTGVLGSAEKDYDAALSGVTSVIHELAGRGVVDLERVGMGGLSFGAGVALWTAFKSDLLAALSLASPSLEPSYYWFNGLRGRDNHERLERWWGLGDPANDRRDWQRMSPALNVDQITAAVLMQLPEQEARLATEFIARLSHSTTPSEVYVFPDEPHIKVQPRHKLAVYERNLDWFRYWLQGYRDPDPAKAGQYERWDALARRSAASASP